MPPGILLMRGLTYVCETDFLRYLQRTLGPLGDDLVCYYVPHTSSWCLGRWVNETRGTVREILSWEHPSELDRGKVRFVRWILTDAYRKDKLRFRDKVKRYRRRWRSEHTDHGRETRMKYMTPRKPQILGG